MRLPARFTVVALFTFCLVGVPKELRAHCDTLNGPVVSAAHRALQSNDVTPVLKWVTEAEEGEVRQAFLRAAAVRNLSAPAQELADRFFFETVVRLHRLGEGEPYTGLKEETEVNAAVEGADKALDTGLIEPVVKLVTDHVAASVRKRFARVRELTKQADVSVAAGRLYVEAYVDFVRYVEAVNAGNSGTGDQTRGSSASSVCQ